jgi:two-component system alkaline phosphatase synthesis response regulator PhoP
VVTEPPPSSRVLIVDDEREIGEVLTAYLQREGFGVTYAATLAQGLEAYRTAAPDIMILDITLPDGSGLDILRAANEGGGRTPAIMLTARTDEIDRIVGLELGADDYVTKPFSPREVVARVRAVMRRIAERGTVKKPSRIRIDGLEIDADAHEVRVDSNVVDLTPTEFRILSVLAENPGQVFTRAALLDSLHDDGSIYERTLDRHINNLRKKIEPNPDEPVYVQTVYGIGYTIKAR